MTDRIPEVTSEKVYTALKILNISDKDYLKDSELMARLSQLNGTAFDYEIFEELWDQCNVKGYVG